MAKTHPAIPVPPPGPWGPQARMQVGDMGGVDLVTTEGQIDVVRILEEMRADLSNLEFDHEAACRDLEDADATRARAARRVEHTAHALRIVRDQYSALAAKVIL